MPVPVVSSASAFSLDWHDAITKLSAHLHLIPINCTDRKSLLQNAASLDELPTHDSHYWVATPYLLGMAV